MERGERCVPEVGVSKRGERTKSAEHADVFDAQGAGCDVLQFPGERSEHPSTYRNCATHDRLAEAIQS